MSPFFPFAGIILGVVFAPTMMAGAVWSVRTTLQAGWRGGLAATTAMSAAQVIWSSVAGVLLFAAGHLADYTDTPLRFLAAAVLAFMALAVKRSRPLTQLTNPHPVGSPWAILRRTFSLALLMPMRFAGYAALIVAVSLHLRDYGWANGIGLGIGIGLGSFAWWIFFTILAALFGKSVPEEISLKSLNKLRVLAVAVLLGLATLTLLPLLISP